MIVQLRSVATWNHRLHVLIESSLRGHLWATVATLTKASGHSWVQILGQVRRWLTALAESWVVCIDCNATLGCFLYVRILVKSKVWHIICTIVRHCAGSLHVFLEESLFCVCRVVVRCSIQRIVWFLHLYLIYLILIDVLYGRSLRLIGTLIDNHRLTQRNIKIDLKVPLHLLFRNFSSRGWPRLCKCLNWVSEERTRLVLTLKMVLKEILFFHL